MNIDVILLPRFLTGFRPLWKIVLVTLSDNFYRAHTRIQKLMLIYKSRSIEVNILEISYYFSGGIVWTHCFIF